MKFRFSTRIFLAFLLSLLGSMAFSQNLGNVTITVNSSPVTGVQVTAAPADLNGSTGGSTQFTLLYQARTSITLTAPATLPGYTFSSWQINRKNFGNGANSITFTATNNLTLTAVYNPVLTVQSSNPNSGVTITNSADVNNVTTGVTTYTLSYPYAQAETVTAPANVGNNPFLYWQLDGVNQTAGNVNLQLNMSGPHTVTAVYQPTNVLTVQSQNPNTGVVINYTPASLSGNTSGTTAFTSVFNTGTPITLTAPATVGFNVFQNWTINGVAQAAGATKVTTTLNADSTAVAVYLTPNFGLTVQSQNPNAGVKVTAAPADNAGSTGGTTTFGLNYPAGTRVTLTAPAKQGNNPFLNWTVNGVNQAAGATAVTTQITGATTAVAVYQPTNVLTVQSQNPATGIQVTNAPADNNGVTTGKTQYTLVYNTGTPVTLTAPATSGFNVFSNWTINGVAQGAGVTAVTTTLNADSTAVAVYVTPNFGLTVQSQNPNAGVKVTAAPADNAGLTGGTTTFGLNYPAGTRVTLTAPANQGNNPFLYWSVNGVNQAAGATAVTTQIAGATTAVAVYQPTNVLTVQSQNPATGIQVTNAPADNNGVTTGKTQYALVYNTGSRVTLTAPGTSGFNVFSNWTINGVAQAAGATTVTTTLNADSTAVAIYITPNFGLTVQSQSPNTGVKVTASPADNGGLTSGSTTFTLNYPAGTKVTLTAPAAVGNNPFLYWTINGVNQLAGATAVTTQIAAATTAVAVYQPTNVLTVQSQNPAAGIQVTNAPADNNGVTTGSTQFKLVYNTGTPVTLTAPATSGFNVFGNWTINGVAQAAGATTVTTTLTADSTAVAVYITPNFGLTIQSQNPNSGVKVTAAPADNAGLNSGATTFTLNYPAGTKVTLTAPAMEGNNPFLYWTVNGVKQAAGATAITTQVTVATTAVAVYQATNVLTVQSQNPATGITVSDSPKDNNGVASGKTQYALVYNTGTSVTLTAPATSGFNVFSNWTINGVAQAAGATTVTTTLNADSIAVAVYVTPNFVLSVQSQNPSTGARVDAAPADNSGSTGGLTAFNLTYPAGTKVSLTARAKFGNNSFLYWTLNGVNQPAGQLTLSTQITAAATAVAVYQSTNIVTVTSRNPGSGISVTDAPADNNGLTSGNTQFVLVYNTGSRITLTAPATSGFNQFGYWVVNGVNQTAGQATTSFAVTADSTAVAVYLTPNYTLTVQSQNPGTGVSIVDSPADNAGLLHGSTGFNLSYPAGVTAILTAPKSVGNNPFLYWTVNGVQQAAGQTVLNLQVSRNSTVVAVYQSTNVLTVQSQNPASGVTVTATPSDNGGTSGGSTQFTLIYNTGSKVTLTAPALQVKQIFNNWIINGVAQPVGQTQVQVTMSADTVAVANYLTPIYTVTTSVLGTHVTVSPTPSATVLLGGNLTFTATPQQGYVVNTWILDGTVAQTGGNSFALSNVQTNHTLEVTTVVVLVFHPADTNKDSKLVIAEITAYGAAWKHGTEWPVGPNPIPQAFVTNAISLWKSGEAYTYDPTKTDPNGWIPLANAPFATISLESGAAATESAVRQLDGSTEVAIQVTPASRTQAMTLEEVLPANVEVVSVGSQGFFDVKRHIIRWGPFLGDQPRSLSYRARFKGAAVVSQGVASFDGLTFAVKKDKSAGGK